jgi:sensor domain CHASE-containing protein
MQKQNLNQAESRNWLLDWYLLLPLYEQLVSKINGQISAVKRIGKHIVVNINSILP